MSKENENITDQNTATGNEAGNEKETAQEPKAEATGEEKEAE